MNLFARLFKYRATEGRSPQEDFLTEALAGVLESSLPLRVEFMNWLVENDLDLERVRVETQKTAGSCGRLDLWLEAWERSGERHAIDCENKVWAGEGDNQLNRYYRYLQKHPAKSASRTLIYLTPHPQCDFKPYDPMVRFREMRWHQVFKWMKAWAKGPDKEARPVVLVKELLTLMEEWNLSMELNASDLAAAVAHRTRVESRLRQILDEVWATCKVEGSKQNQWKYDYRHLLYRSPRIGAEKVLYLEFGFDFGSEDEHWNVQSLSLPSAYFALWGDGVGQLPALPDAWNHPPDYWGWSSKTKVKRMCIVEVKGDSLHSAYRDFFMAALQEAEEAISRL